jgi:hypothetical protein
MPYRPYIGKPLCSAPASQNVPFLLNSAKWPIHYRKPLELDIQSVHTETPDDKLQEAQFISFFYLI